MIPNSAIPDAINALDQKAQATGDDTASKSLAKTVSDLSANAPAPESAAPESSTPSPASQSDDGAPSKNADILHPDTAAALEKLGYDDATIAKLNQPQVRAILQHQLPPRTAFTPRLPLPADSPFAKPPDPAAPILAAEPNLDNETRAQIWDAYHNSKTPSDFADVIAPFDVSNDLKHRLFLSKAQSVPVAVAPVDKVIGAIQKMVAIPTETLDLVEKHSHVLNAFTSVKE